MHNIIIGDLVKVVSNRGNYVSVFWKLLCSNPPNSNLLLRFGFLEDGRIEWIMIQVDGEDQKNGDLFDFGKTTNLRLIEVVKSINETSYGIAKRIATDNEGLLLSFGARDRTEGVARNICSVI